MCGKRANAIVAGAVCLQCCQTGRANTAGHVMRAIIAGGGPPLLQWMISEGNLTTGYSFALLLGFCNAFLAVLFAHQASISKTKPVASVLPHSSDELWSNALASKFGFATMFYLTSAMLCLIGIVGASSHPGAVQSVRETLRRGHSSRLFHV